MQIREIMTADVASVEPETTVEEIATIMRDMDTGVVPVVDEDKELLGIVTDRDIVIRCIAAGKNASEMAADEILTEELETIEPTTDVEEASRLMARKQVRRLPVVEGGCLVGMVSLGDIAVKGSEQNAGNALESVSRGVKPSRRGTAQRQAQPQARKGQPARRQAAVSAEQRLDQERGEGRMITGGRNAPQGISNRNIGEEARRQSKVVPIRNEGKTTRKRRAS
ncbi:MAG: CBS domain-containing protein [Terriglobales bacterium]